MLGPTCASRIIHAAMICIIAAECVSDIASLHGSIGSMTKQAKHPQHVSLTAESSSHGVLTLLIP